MSRKQDKSYSEMDGFIKAAIQKVEPVSPGPDFTRSVMFRVTNEKESLAASLRRQPLISPGAWFAIGFFVLALLILTVKTVDPSGSLTPYFVAIQQFFSQTLQLFVPRLVIVASLSCAALVVFQVWLLTKKMDNAL
jgi:hypothetical protein